MGGAHEKQMQQEMAQLYVFYVNSYFSTYIF